MPKNKYCKLSHSFSTKLHSVEHRSVICKFVFPSNCVSKTLRCCVLSSRMQSYEILPSYNSDRPSLTVGFLFQNLLSLRSSCTQLFITPPSGTAVGLSLFPSQFKVLKLCVCGYVRNRQRLSSLVTQLYYLQE